MDQEDSTLFKTTEFKTINNRIDDKTCPFCDKKNRYGFIREFNTARAIEDASPVTKGHMLIIPKRHCSDYFDMTDQEIRDANALIVILKNMLSEKDPSITGFNIGMNIGYSAGQTVFHSHIHLIPRRDGDTPFPRGGVRGVIPDKMSY